MKTFMNELIDCMMMLGKPTARMLLNTEASGRNPRQTTLSSWFFSWLSTKPSSMPPIWPITVAAAAPATPICGKPSRPKIMIGSRMMLMTAPVSCVVIDSMVLPVACIIRSKEMDRNRPKLNTVTMRR